MALLECIECGGKVSDKAEFCIHCGCPVSVIIKQSNETKITYKTEKNSYTRVEVLDDDMNYEYFEDCEVYEDDYFEPHIDDFEDYDDYNDDVITNYEELMGLNNKGSKRYSWYSEDCEYYSISFECDESDFINEYKENMQRLRETGWFYR